MTINNFPSLQKKYTISNIMTKNCDIQRKRNFFIVSFLLKICTMWPGFVQKSVVEDGFGT